MHQKVENVELQRKTARNPPRKLLNMHQKVENAEKHPRKHPKKPAKNPAKKLLNMRQKVENAKYQRKDPKKDLRNQAKNELLFNLNFYFKYIINIIEIKKIEII